MARLSSAYRTLWGLTGNPFPDHAIASAGDRDQPFYEQLHPGIGSNMARAFLGTDGKFPRVAFLWSLGQGEDARGFGKTRHLLWFAERTNADLGSHLLKLAGHAKESDRLLAAYAAFSTVEGVSLSNLLFDVVMNCARTQGNRVVALRANEMAKRKTPCEIYESADKRLCRSEASYSSRLLSKLAFDAPPVWIEYLESFGQWHKVRYGREMLRTLVAFLSELGVSRVLVLVDQVEDFARYTTPSYKLDRDFSRLAHLCSGDKVLRNNITFVLTMHPVAARIVSRYWPDRTLGQIDAIGEAENVVLIGPMVKSRFINLTKAYIDAARLEESSNTSSPFADEALEFIHERERGRPGYCLQRLFYVMDLAAAARTPRIERAFVERCLEGVHS